MVDDTDPSKAIEDINKKLADIDARRNELLSVQHIYEAELQRNESNRKLVSQLNGVNIGEVSMKIDQLNKTINTLSQLKQLHAEHQRLYNEYLMDQQTLSSELKTLQTDDMHCKQTMNELMTNKENDNECKLISDATSSTKGLPVVMIRNTLE